MAESLNTIVGCILLVQNRDCDSRQAGETMPRAEVMYHFVRGKTDGTNFPDRALVELFRTAKVSLKLTLGAPLDPGETLRPSELVDRWKPNNASIGHLVISNQCKDPRYLEIAGQLMDLSSRG